MSNVVPQHVRPTLDQGQEGSKSKREQDITALNKTGPGVAVRDICLAVGCFLWIARCHYQQ